ncbi:hypothetical protein Fuma_06277 [Fuerstiella marisgermanici]|uniref:Uncharacterized protein n=1 Tax=Fuerstiella marisgermanici TaxID=1891926 RepID=A0A1P8WRC8_9PLAN|nr:hypothetical protein Fuma_06277 [Fuerstiella marisgermanici]
MSVMRLVPGRCICCASNRGSATPRLPYAILPGSKPPRDPIVPCSTTRFTRYPSGNLFADGPRMFFLTGNRSQTVAGGKRSATAGTFPYTPTPTPEESQNARRALRTAG